MNQLEATMTSPFETELHRQREYLDDLPGDFDYPLLSGRQAVESQRRSGYKTSARAAREIVDNAVEAGAQSFWVVFDTVREEARKKGQWRETVSAVAFIDDGPGMVHESMRTMDTR